MAANLGASKSIAVLSNVEENKSVSHALARLSEVEDKVGQLHLQQQKDDLFLITEVVKDYVGLMNSIRVSKGHRRGFYCSLQRGFYCHFCSLVVSSLAYVRLVNS